MKIQLVLLPLFFGSFTFAQSPTSPCVDDYGSAQDEANIIQQMRFGSITDAQNAIEQAKKILGERVWDVHNWRTITIPPITINQHWQK